MWQLQGAVPWCGQTPHGSAHADSRSKVRTTCRPARRRRCVTCIIALSYACCQISISLPDLTILVISLCWVLVLTKRHLPGQPIGNLAHRSQPESLTQGLQVQEPELLRSLIFMQSITIGIRC